MEKVKQRTPKKGKVDGIIFQSDLRTLFDWKVPYIGLQTPFLRVYYFPSVQSFCLFQTLRNQVEKGNSLQNNRKRKAGSALELEK